ncbi:MAG: hypothetical protein SGILL_001316 [Bacillariaceae sp.]
MAPQSTTAMAFSGNAAACQTSPAAATLSALEQARQLTLPPVDKVLARDGSVYQFWDNNDELLEQAWKEWNASEEAKQLPKIDASILNPKLKAAVEKAWAEPSLENEQAIHDL